MPDNLDCADPACDGLGVCDPMGIFEPAGTLCSDGLFCNGDDSCDGSGFCVSGDTNPCSMPYEVCNEDLDHCDTTCVDIEKSAKVEGDGSFYSEWLCDQVPLRTYDSAEYRLTVTNCGTLDLNNVVVKDFDLGIDYTIGTIATGDEVTLDKDDIPELNVADVCQFGNEFVNTALVYGVGEYGFPVEDDSSVCVVVFSCQPVSAENLPELIIDLEITEQGLEDGLLDKAVQVQEKIDAGKIEDACQQLTEMINQTAGQSHHIDPPEEADLLIEYLQDIQY